MKVFNLNARRASDPLTAQNPHLGPSGVKPQNYSRTDYAMNAFVFLGALPEHVSCGPHP